MTHDTSDQRFNLSAISLRHRVLVLYFMLVLSLAGAIAFLHLGRAEDPPFTVKTMVASAQWPGATTREMEQQVADRMEAKLQELPYFDNVVSYSRPGETVLKVTVRHDTPPKVVPELWYQVRKKLNDIRPTLPNGVQGPSFNDEFGDVYSFIYAFSGGAAGFGNAELRKYVEDVRERLLRVPGVGKVDLLGAQPEKIYVEFSNMRLSTFGLTADQVLDSLRRQNAVAASGIVETSTDRVTLRIEGSPDTVAVVKAIPVVAEGHTLTVGDVADVRRGYEDPRVFTMRFMGDPVIGLGIVMAEGGNVLDLGRAVESIIKDISATLLPAGVDVRTVANEAAVVDHSISEFVRALGEALGIVLVVSFLTLGLRTGVVVALTVPLVLAITFLLMAIMGIHLHRISLGALIIALGLLVDDAIIAVEMMLVKLEEGFDRVRAATYAYTSTAFPMLTGTLVTAVGFVPVGFAHSTSGEYTGSIFWVVATALLVSWIAAVIFTPYLGIHLIPEIRRDLAHGADQDGREGQLRWALQGVVRWCVVWSKSVVVVTGVCFIVSILAFRLFVAQQFFPASSRPELMVDIRLPEGSSFTATEAAARRLEAHLAKDDAVENQTAYVGGGAPRFYLPLNPDLKHRNLAQFVILTKGLEARNTLLARLQGLFETAEFADINARVVRLENGPPVGFPVQFRVLGHDPDVIRGIAAQVRDVMRTDPGVRDVNLEWNEKAKTVRLVVDEAKERALGVDPQTLASALDSMLSGSVITQYREGNDLIDVVARAVARERLRVDQLEDITVRTQSGATVPLAQVATLRYELEDPVLWRRNRETMLTVRADLAGNAQAPDVSARLLLRLQPIIDAIPAEYHIEVGGVAEESAKARKALAEVMPIMVALMLTILMIQLQSFSRLALVVLTAPLGMIGVTGALLASGQPFGFVSLLGVVALAGMIMRNSVILVVQIDQDIQAGHAPFDAIVEATVRRARPILLTAAAAIFAMIPLSGNVFWGPMAVAIMGGLTVATFLTLLFLPALYAAWFHIRPLPSAVFSAEAPDTTERGRCSIGHR
jgi:multidrug efflux pump